MAAQSTLENIPLVCNLIPNVPFIVHGQEIVLTITGLPLLKVGL